MQTIQLPPQTRSRIEALLAQRNTLQNLLNAIIDTAAEALQVPPDYELRDLNVGWQQKEQKESGAPDATQ